MTKHANPGPLGLFAFGVTTILLNFENAGISETTLLNLVLAHGLFFGGAAQVAAGLWELAVGNTFGATAFSSYGAFWMSLAAFLWAHQGGLFDNVQEVDLFIYFLVWAGFSALLWIITFRINQGLMVVFGSLVLLFVLLAIGEYDTAVHEAAGYVGILCGGSALYVGYADLINETWKGSFLPIGSYVRPVQATEKEALTSFPNGNPEMPDGLSTNQIACEVVSEDTVGDFWNDQKDPIPIGKSSFQQAEEVNVNLTSLLPIIRPKQPQHNAWGGVLGRSGLKRDRIQHAPSTTTGAVPGDHARNSW
eukprot:CAMPEP_0206468134 /NCGR_PEP_ID=MMETSP0324_2-20121206/29437_1 /ASSEMBLY_ACC=CAM_ASM_000836 /TAXON_ID=2866 /ORGANISM="Crypthecodinium cohnii, Strain Seligo" /LENGTH=305 /DNA_ID=CAMNT_0053941511 /DNA_START=46 /DNA_END=961 /DNA_ORIENTATION=+